MENILSDYAGFDALDLIVNKDVARKCYITNTYLVQLTHLWDN